MCRGSRVELGQSLSCSAEYCLRRLNESKHLSHGISTQQAIDGDKTLQTFWLYCFFPKFHSAKKRPQKKGFMFHPQQAGKQDEGSDMVTVDSDNECADAREADEDRMLIPVKHNLDCF